MAKFNFDVSEYQDFGGSFEPLPIGEYELMATKCDLKNTKAGDGQYFSTTFEVLGPTHAGRFVFSNYNIVNPSAKAEELGRMQLSSWARAVGKPNASDTDDLLNLPFIGLIGIEKGTGDYKDKNKIDGYKAKIGSVGGAPRGRGRPPGSTNKPAPAPASEAPAATPEAPAAEAPKPAPRPAPAPAAPSGKKAPWDE